MAARFIPRWRSVAVCNPPVVAAMWLRLFYTTSCPIFWVNSPFPASGPAQCRGFFMTVNKCWGLLRFPTPLAWFFPSPGGSLPPLGTPPSATITTQPWLMVLPMLELLSHHGVDLEDEKHSELAAGRARLAPLHGITGTDLCLGLFWVRKAGFEGWCSHARYQQAFPVPIFSRNRSQPSLAVPQEGWPRLINHRGKEPGRRI